MLFLAVVTVLLVVAAPAVMSLFLDSSWDDPDLAAQRESVVAFARFCLPQVFFYGMFVLVGQILNARGRFGPMMWAPIANNVISVAVLVIYLVSFGPATGSETTGGFSSDQELLLGIGSTLGIAAQLLILLPYLRSAGFHYRPRFDFRHTGLAHTLRLATWTVLFVIVNQVAYTIVVRLASGGTTGGDQDGTGYAVYAAAFLIVMVPHSVITVSLTTAILPRLSRLAADGDLAGLARNLAATLRTALAVVVPFAALLPVVAPDIANVVLGSRRRAPTYDNAVPTLSLFGAGVVFFTVHFLMLRGFYALEQTRTVFWIQCGVAVTNIAAAMVLVGLTDAKHTAPALVVAYTASYAVGSVISYAVLRTSAGRPGDAGARRLPGGAADHHRCHHRGGVRTGPGGSLAERPAALGAGRAAGGRDHGAGGPGLPVDGPVAAAQGGHLGDRSGEASAFRSGGRPDGPTMTRGGSRSRDAKGRTTT